VALPWSRPGWLDEVVDWIDARVERTGVVETLHERAWSAMLRVPTRAGDAYFKAAAPALAHEAGLTEALVRWRPDCTAELVAVDVDRGWLLMLDSGTTLRDVLTAPEEYEPLLALFAELQVQVAPRRDEILALGTPDRRLERLPELADPLPVDGDLVRRLIAEVESYELPETLVHEEVAPNNTLVRDGGFVFVDWSDSSVGHPFFGIVVALRSIADCFELEPGAPELERILDAYLEPWTAHLSRGRLRALFPAAYRLGMLNRALTWHMFLASLDPPERGDYASYVTAWIEECVAADPPRPGT
jgi:hypothetical protein